MKKPKTGKKKLPSAKGWDSIREIWTHSSKGKGKKSGRNQ